MANWNRNGILFAPPESNSVVDKALAAAQSNAPLLVRKSFAHVRYEAIRSFVAGLLFGGRPSAIGRFVMPVAVNSVDRHPGRRFAHVGQEVLELHPAFANLYASASVVLKTRDARACASVFHSRPNAVRLCAAHLVSGVFCDKKISLATAARDGFPRTKVADNNSRCRAATALANPSLMSARSIFCTRNNRQMAEYRPSKVFEFLHFVTSKWLTVEGAWQSAVRQIFGSYPSQAVEILA